MVKVLVIEPDNSMQKLVASLLEDAGLPATICGSLLGLVKTQDAEIGAVIVGDSGRNLDFGIETVLQLRQREAFKKIPILLVNNRPHHTPHKEPEDLARCITAGANYVLRQPFVVHQLIVYVKRLLSLHYLAPAQQAAVARNVMIHLEQFPDVMAHGERVATLAARFATWLGLERPMVDDIYAAGLIHDVGKIAIPRHILLKPSLLIPWEKAIVNLHADYGATLCEHFLMAPRVVEAVRYHHERHDGSGAPFGLQGAAIQTHVEIVALVDAFDALCEKRVYRDALAPSRSLRILREEAACGLWKTATVEMLGEYLQHTNTLQDDVALTG